MAIWSLELFLVILIIVYSEEEQKRGITMKSSAITLFYEDQISNYSIGEDNKIHNDIKKKPYVIDSVHFMIH